MPRLDRDPEELKYRAQRRWGPRNGWQCVYCGTKLTLLNSQVDHFFPYWLTKDSSPRNLVPCCRTCNHAKRGRQPAEWMHAVGVPANVIKFLMEVYEVHPWRRYDTLVFPVTSLNYAAGMHLPAGPRQQKAYKPIR